jgi:hypothetical protein
MVLGSIVLGGAAVWLLLRQPLRLYIALQVGSSAPLGNLEVSYGPFRRRITMNPAEMRSVRFRDNRLWKTLVRRRFVAAISVIRPLRYLGRRLAIEKFQLTIAIGCDDAARTAMWVGRLSALVATSVNALVAPLALSPPGLAILPLWHESRISVEFTSIIRLRPSDIILAMGMALWGQFRRRTDP